MFRLDRVMEYFTEAELAKHIGYVRPWWVAAVPKELIDNGLDAAREANAEEVDLPSDLADQVAKHLGDNPTCSWDAAVARIARERAT